MILRFFRQYSRCRSVNCCIAVASNVVPRACTRHHPRRRAAAASCGARHGGGKPGLALELSGDLWLESLEVPDDLPRLLGLVPVHVHARQLVPAVRAHGLQLGVALERDHRFVVAALADQHEAEPVPGAIELVVQRERAAKGRLGLGIAAVLVEQEAEVEPVCGAARGMRGHQGLRVGDGVGPPPELGAHVAAAGERIRVVRPLRHHLAEGALGGLAPAEQQLDDRAQLQAPELESIHQRQTSMPACRHGVDALECDHQVEDHHEEEGHDRHLVVADLARRDLPHDERERLREQLQQLVEEVGLPARPGQHVEDALADQREQRDVQRELQQGQ